MSEVPKLWTGDRPPFRLPGMKEKQWLSNLAAGRIAGATVRGVAAVAVAETLQHFQRAPDWDPVDLPWDLTGAEHVKCVRIVKGLELPKYDEVDFLLRTPETAPLLGSRLLLGYLNRLTDTSARSGVTHLIAHGVPVKQHASTTVAPALDRVGAETAAQKLLVLLERSVRDVHSTKQPKHLHLLSSGPGGAYAAKPLTQRDMVRAVIPRDRTPITNSDIRAAVAARFGDAAPTDRQIDQTIVGLRRDGELRRAAHGVQKATSRLGHDPYPTDPTRKRARS